MYFLLDYDNIDGEDRRHGVERLVFRILDTVGAKRLAGASRVTIRLYGGWFRGANRSRRAQELIAELSTSFQSPFTLSDPTTGNVVVRLTGGLADALLAAPQDPIVNTYREAIVDTSRYRQADAPYRQCAEPANCPLHTVLTQLKQPPCPTVGCAVSISHLLSRWEQKLVDTMLVADLIELARQREPTVVVVSSDDDIWPGILAATSLGTSVLHLQSRSRTAPRHYSALAPANRYDQLVLPRI